MKHSLNIISSFTLLIQSFLDENIGLPDGEKQHDISPTGKSEFRFTGHGPTMVVCDGKDTGSSQVWGVKTASSMAFAK